MHAQRLLERIACLESGDTLVHATQMQILILSIQNHLQRILNTRQGSVPIDPDFGVPDFTNIAGSFTQGFTNDIIKDMTRMVKRYEQRLKNPVITIEEPDFEVLSLSFSLQGTIEVNNREIPVRLSTRVSSSGRVTLKA